MLDTARGDTWLAIWHKTTPSARAEDRSSPRDTCIKVERSVFIIPEDSRTHLESGLYLVPEVVDVVVLHGGSLCLPLGSEGDTGRPLVHGLTTATGLTGDHPESEVIRVLQSYNERKYHIVLA